jgi:hypothetical protein
MRFKTGQVYACVDNELRAIVTETRSQGREGLLRLVPGGSTEWVLWHQLHHAGKWHLQGGPQ